MSLKKHYYFLQVWDNSAKKFTASKKLYLLKAFEKQVLKPVPVFQTQDHPYLAEEIHYQRPFGQEGFYLKRNRRLNTSSVFI